MQRWARLGSRGNESNVAESEGSMRRRAILGGISIKGTIAGMVLSLGLVMTPMAMAASSTVVVTGDDVAQQAENTAPTKNWVAYIRNAGSDTFVNGPGTPPLGTGSLQLSTPTGADKITVFNFDYVGTKLTDINAMAYNTYRSAGDAQQVAALNIQVDVNGAADGGFTTLVFEPVYNTGQGSVVSNQWQAWDAYNGGQATWWSSNPIPGAPNRDTFVSWSTILSNNPDAVIVGGFGVNQGSGNPALTTAVDALKLGVSETSVTYNFELTKPVTTPSCREQAATIYVKDGKIVGGPDNGKTYKGKLKGTKGADVIVGTDGADTIEGNNGDDVICGLGGNDTLRGNNDNDIIDGGAGNDKVDGGNGNDTLYGGEGDDRVEGNDGNDTLYGDAGKDRLEGGNGNDSLTGGADADRFSGGPGTDTANDYSFDQGDTRDSIP